MDFLKKLFNKDETVSSGITLKLVDNSTIENSKNLSLVLNFLSRLIVLFMLTSGAVFTFTSMMNIKKIDWIIYIVIAAASLILTSCYRAFKKSWLVLVVGICSAGISWLFMLTPVFTGFQLIYDSVIKSIYSAMFWTAPDPILTWNDSYISNTTYCMCMIAVVICSAAGYFAVAKSQFIGAFLITFAFFEIGAAFGCIGDRLSFAILLSGWAAMLVLHISNRQKNIVKHKNLDKVLKKKQFVYKDKSARFGGSAIVMAVSIFLVFLISMNVLISSGFSRDSNLESLRKNVKYTALNIYDLITGFDHDASLKDGDLTVLGDRKVLNRHYATLKTANVKEDLYFKGYVGSVYTGHSWDELDDNAYKSIENFTKYLKEREYTLPTLTGDLLDSDLIEKNLKNSDFSFSDFRRKKPYMYALNGTVSTAAITGYKDIFPQTEKTSEYLYNAYYDQTDFVNLPYTTSFTNSDFQKVWKEYVNFVNANYTLLPSGIDEVAKLGTELKGTTIYETVDKVRQFLNDNTKYSDKVSKLPKGKDFVSNFIFDKGEGYSAHYASAAAVMLRSLGVPARYVEGFYVPKEQIQKADGTTTKTLELTDGNYHAWIEIFDQNYGWISVETTPGYYSKSFAALMKQEQNKAKNKNKEKPKEDNKPNDEQKPADIDNKENQQPVENPNEQKPAENKTDDYKESSWLIYVSIIVGAILLLLIIGVLTLIIRRLLVIKKRTAIFNSNNYRKQVTLGFDLIIQMLRFNKVELDIVYSYEDFEKIVKDNFVTDDEKDYSLEDIFAIYEKTMFSKIPISENQAQTVLDFIDEFGYGIYSNLTFAKRLKFKYINLLV